MFECGGGFLHLVAGVHLHVLERLKLADHLKGAHAQRAVQRAGLLLLVVPWQRLAGDEALAALDAAVRAHQVHGVVGCFVKALWLHKEQAPQDPAHGQVHAWWLGRG